MIFFFYKGYTVLTIHTIARPLGWDMGCYFSSKSDLCFNFVRVMLCAISCYIGQCCDMTHPHHQLLVDSFDDTFRVTPLVLRQPHLWLSSRMISNIWCTKSQNINVSRLVLQLSLCNLFKPGVENEDVVGAVRTGDAPTTSERSAILLPVKVWLILEIWQ